MSDAATVTGQRADGETRQSNPDDAWQKLIRQLEDCFADEKAPWIVPLRPHFTAAARRGDPFLSLPAAVLPAFAKKVTAACASIDPACDSNRGDGWNSRLDPTPPSPTPPPPASISGHCCMCIHRPCMSLLHVHPSTLHVTATGGMDGTLDSTQHPPLSHSATPRFYLRSLLHVHPSTLHVTATRQRL
ncbi:unnamed protein product [Closterium sp. NIES-64]|nr:unnamed protein product [Closterium sp. NIES-64]